jgi:DNA polymerase-3 subunit delta
VVRAILARVAEPAVTLITGDEEFLAGRAVAARIAAAGPDAEVSDLAASDVEAGSLAELLSPSLFGGPRVVVIRSTHELGKDACAALTAYAGDPSDEVALVVVHPGGSRNKAFVDALRGSGAATVEVAKLRWPEERERFVVAEVEAAGGSISHEAAAELVAAVGTELRELASAAAQLVADCGGTVDVDVVARYHRGRAEATGFVVADKAVEGDAVGALETLRWGLGVGMAPVLVTSSLAANLRLVAGVAAAGRASPQSLASSLGAAPWKVRKAQGWARGWRPEGLATAVRAVADADAAVKGGAADPAYALERLVLTVAGARGRG